MNQCVDCGKPTNGIRCREHHSEHLKRQHLMDTLHTDVEVLAMVEEGATSGDISDRLGISRTRAADKMNIAKARMEKRLALNLPTQLISETA